VDHDPVGTEDIHVHVKVTVRGDKLTVDFTGSDTRQDLKAYSSFGNTRGYVVAQLATMMDPSIPKNEGFFESIELVVPKGCVLNPEEGKTVAAGTHHPGVEVGEAIAIAMSRVLPHRSSPQVYKMGMPTVVVGRHPETGKLYIDHGVDTLAAYASAVSGQDGWGSMPASFGNLIRGTAEIKESLYPIRHEFTDYRTDSGGAGRWRGCPGSRIVKRVTAPATVSSYIVGVKYPMPGLGGGKPGAGNQLTVRAGTTHATVVDRLANAVPHEAGEAFEYLYGGGGGWGDPLEREPARVLEDVLDEYVSVEAARREYGVVLEGTLEEYDLRVDETATRALRDRMRAQPRAGA
jgi:N-methylhydantoinase B